MARENEKPPAIGEGRYGMPLWMPIAVAAAALLVYINTLANGFVFDDIPIILENPNIRGLSKIPAIFSSGYGEGTQLGFTALYRPVVILSFAINYQVGGLSPWHYHLVNSLLHAVNALLVTLLAFRLFEKRFAAISAGLIFALHSVNTEAVAPVVGRTDLLGTLFSLAALLLYAKYRSSNKRKVILAASLACLLAGLLSKEHAVVVPAFIMLWDLVKKKEPFWEFAGKFPRRLVFRYSMFIAVVIAYLVMRLLIVGKVGVGGTISELDNPLAVMNQPARFFTAGKVSLAYLSRLIAPLTLAHDYSYPQITPANTGQGIAFIFVFAVLAWACFQSFKKDRRLFFGLMFFLIAFSIVSNLVITIGTIMAERLLYLPGIGFCIAAAVFIDYGNRYLASKKNESFARNAVIVFLIPVCLFLAVRTFVRNRDWQSQLSLYEQAVRVVPYNAKVRMGYGQTLSEQRRLDEALAQFRASLKLLGTDREGRFRYVTADILFDVANIYKKQENFEEAIPTYEQALKLRHDRPEFLFNYGQTLLEAERPEDAAAVFQKYIALDPEFHEAHNAYALALEALGDFDAAKKSYLKSIQLKPDYAKAHRNLALLYITRLNQPEKAVLHLEKTLEYDPGQPDADKFRKALEMYRQQQGGRK